MWCYAVGIGGWEGNVVGGGVDSSRLMVDFMLRRCANKSSNSSVLCRWLEELQLKLEAAGATGHV